MAEGGSRAASAKRDANNHFSLFLHVLGICVLHDVNKGCVKTGDVTN